MYTYDIEYDLPEDQKVCRCCQKTMHRIGEDVTEQLHIPPAKPWVWQHVRFKYGCRHCGRHEISAPQCHRNRCRSALRTRPRSPLS